MGVIAKVVEFLRTTVDGEPVTDVKFDEGGEDMTTGELYQPAGFDASPLPGDYVLAVRVPGEARFAVIGYIDPANQLTAAPGESRLFSRDSDGNVVATILLGADGFVNLGEDVAAALMARADRVDAELELIKAALTAVSNGGGALTGANPYTVVTPTGADKVKGT